MKWPPHEKSKYSPHITLCSRIVSGIPVVGYLAIGVIDPVRLSDYTKQCTSPPTPVNDFDISTLSSPTKYSHSSSISSISVSNFMMTANGDNQLIPPNVE